MVQNFQKYFLILINFEFFKDLKESFLFIFEEVNNLGTEVFIVEKLSNR